MNLWFCPLGRWLDLEGRACPLEVGWGTNAQWIAPVSMCWAACTTVPGTCWMWTMLGVVQISLSDQLLLVLIPLGPGGGQE